METTVAIETFAQFEDPVSGRLSIIISDGEAVLQAEDGTRLRLSLEIVGHLGDLLERHRAADRLIKTPLA